jgi:hypothetical protein
MMSNRGALRSLLDRWLTALWSGGPPEDKHRPPATAAFDQTRADHAIQKLGIEIASGSDFNARPWTDLVVVANFKDGGRSMFGYVFWGERDWEAAGPDGWVAIDLAEELHHAMSTTEHGSWQKRRIRITRETGEIDIDFDYAGDKWVPIMSDPAAFAFGLRH